MIPINAFQIIRSFQRTPPSDVFGMIKALGIEASRADLPDGVSVVLCRSDGSSANQILINTRLNSACARFSAAHALAHELMHADLLPIGDHVDRLFPQGPDDGSLSAHHEEQANRVALDVLLPLPIIAPLLSEDDDQAVRLAKIFDVPEKAMRIRLRAFDTDIGHLILEG